MSNQKDSVGKVTIAVNVAGALNQRGRDVLLVDLDPQGNATEGLGFADAYDAEPPSLFNVLTDSEQRGEIKRLVREHPEMDVIPSNVDHHHTEREMTHVRRPTEQLALALEDIGQHYNYVLIDCPPSLGHLTDNALYAGWFARAFDDIPRFEVRKRVALQRAHSAGSSLFEYDPEIDMCDVFLEIAAALDEQFGLSPAETASTREVQ
ncbi:ParA family protein [Halococcus sp. AFM35]|uniref:ParA family protein n=1 Tax=Halococcus sp. AFM35 TaxID=3421653 RepID=UPI003EB97FCF